MPKNVVVCLDGTNNQIHGSVNTNVVRLYTMLDLSDPTVQVGYYAPGVGTFSSPAAWTPLARTISRYEGLALGFGLRQELANAYSYLMGAYEDGDRVFVLGFSRGAYTARALTGLLNLIGLFRPGAENLVTYAVTTYARRGAHEDWDTLRTFSDSFARVVTGHGNRVPVHFLGLWDTVKAAGTLTRQLTWPYTVHLERVATVRHAMAIDEKRRPYRPYPVEPLRPGHDVTDIPQDLQQVWFAGVHSDVGGMFPSGARLSDIPLKWMAQHARAAGLVTVPTAYDRAMTQVNEECAIGPVHRMGAMWALAGTKRRVVPPGSTVHASVRDRIAEDASYERWVPEPVFVDDDWLTSR